MSKRWRVCSVALESWARLYRGKKFHAMLCDPPYELGFMNKGWDRQGTAFRSETWAMLGEHLHPGAFVMAFASSRGWHRLAVAIEDAGFIIHPSMFGWAYGSGFPKATRIKDERFNGHRYGRQSLKPSLEPIITAQKPYENKPQEDIIATGAGSLNIDAGRVSSGEQRPLIIPEDTGARLVFSGRGSRRAGVTQLGRWPANFYLVHSPECKPVGTVQLTKETRTEVITTRIGYGGGGRQVVTPMYGNEQVTAWDCADGCPVERLGRQSGERAAGSAKTGQEPSDMAKNTYGARERIPFVGHQDKGTAARFYHQADWAAEVMEQLEMAEPVLYQPKASQAERDRGLDVAARAVGDGRKKSIDNAYQRGETLRRNVHPTVKPLALTEWLAKLLLPPEGYERRLLVPFSGSGSEMIGALRAGWDHIEGIEMKKEYVDSARARLGYWSRIPIQRPLFDLENEGGRS